MISRHLQGTEKASVNKTQLPSPGTSEAAKEPSILCDAFSPEVDAQVSCHLQEEDSDFDGEVRDDLGGGGEMF